MRPSGVQRFACHSSVIQVSVSSPSAMRADAPKSPRKEKEHKHPTHGTNHRRAVGKSGDVSGSQRGEGGREKATAPTSEASLRRAVGKSGFASQVPGEGRKERERRSSNFVPSTRGRDHEATTRRRERGRRAKDGCESGKACGQLHIRAAGGSKSSGMMSFCMAIQFLMSSSSITGAWVMSRKVPM